MCGCCWLAKQLPHNLSLGIHLGRHVGLQGGAILDVRILEDLSRLVKLTSDGAFEPGRAEIMIQ
jgi:hypothetical protein